MLGYQEILLVPSLDNLEPSVAPKNMENGLCIQVGVWMKEIKWAIGKVKGSF